jgi:hypothetical protein
LRNDPVYGARVIVNELRLNVGVVRADIAVVSPEQFWIIEIKSDLDTLLRLDRQQRCYGQLADHVELVVGWRLSARAMRAAPPWWELWLAERKPDSTIALIPLRDPAPNPSQKRFVMARMLPVQRTLRMLGERDADHGVRSASRDAIAERAAEVIPIADLRRAIADYLGDR